VITRISGHPGHDWIAEGLAEYYSIELLHRTGGTTGQRYQRTRQHLKRWSRDVDRLNVRRSSGAVTARAVLLLMDLDAEIREATGDEHSLDDVTRALMKIRKVDAADLAEAAERLMGRPATTLDTPLLQ
jgi:predicted metalloprotease with PDZ domain